MIAEGVALPSWVVVSERTTGRMRQSVRELYPCPRSRWSDFNARVRPVSQLHKRVKKRNNQTYLAKVGVNCIYIFLQCANEEVGGRGVISSRCCTERERICSHNGEHTLSETSETLPNFLFLPGR